MPLHNLIDYFLLLRVDSYPGLNALSISETLPARFFANAQRYRGRTAHYYQRNQDWFPMGWDTMGRVVRNLAAGLISLGHQPSEPVAIVSRSRREWIYWELAIWAAGGISVGIFATLDGSECRHIIRDAEVRYCIVEDAEQLDKVRPCLVDGTSDEYSDIIQMPQPGMDGDRMVHVFAPPRPNVLRAIIVLNPNGVDADGIGADTIGADTIGADTIGADTSAAEPRIVTHDALLDRMRHSHVGQADRETDARVAAIDPLDAASFMYTSGTTSVAKGAMISHGALIASMEAIERGGLFKSGDICVATLPPAHSLQRLIEHYTLWAGVASGYLQGRSQDLRSIVNVSPSVVVLSPFLLERMYQLFHEEAERSPALRRLLAWVRDLGKQKAHDHHRERKVPPSIHAQLALAGRLLAHRLRTAMGANVRLILTGGGPVAPDIVEFFDSAGLSVLECWGMAETYAVGAMNVPHERRVGSIGKPMAGVEFALADDGELLIRGDCVCSGYFRDEWATAAAFTADGYFRTGDMARMDDDGFYYCLGRKSDVIVTAGGERVFAQSIEGVIKSDPRVEHVVVVGHRRPFLVALVSIVPSLRSLVEDDALQRIVDGIFANKNIDLAQSQQIRGFRILPHPLREESGELTPTSKLKRAVIIDKFRYLIDEMYDEMPNKMYDE